MFIPKHNKLKTKTNFAQTIVFMTDTTKLLPTPNPNHRSLASIWNAVFKFSVIAWNFAATSFCNLKPYLDDAELMTTSNWS